VSKQSNWLLQILAICVLSHSCILLAADPVTAPKVKTTQGEAAGKWIVGGTQKAFLGLPYAAPPVGDLRWKAPQPPAPWKGVRDATNFGARCEQWHIWNDYIFLDHGPSEDCLFLNVYAPASATQASKLPVMVWIHGGGFAAGAGSEPRYTNPALVSRNVVVVTLNYRLGVFGFLANQDLANEGNGHAGNYGLMDQVAALQWVKANAAQFGGDPSNVTIFGESAGSFSVNALMAAPSAQGLFQKAIGESGAFFGNVIPMPTVADRAKADQAWTDSLGAKTLAELRAMPADAILSEAKKRSTIGFAPVIDGQLLTESIPTTYAAGREAHVPTIIGWNRDERAGTLSKGMTAEKWKAYATEHYGKQAPQFLAAFPASSDAQAVQSADAYTTAGFIALGAWRWVEAQTATGHAPVYRYRFDLGSPASEVHPIAGYAFHSDELEYVFGTLDSRVGATWRLEDRKLSDQLIGYWTNFARTGDPNGKGLANWPRYDRDPQLIHLDNPLTTAPDTARPQFEFLLNAEPAAH
jgi:para-nitrobenzyl esterase